MFAQLPIDEQLRQVRNAMKPATGTTIVKLPDGRSLSFPTAQAAAEFKKKAGIQ
jgi:hypothetical protein